MDRQIKKAQIERIDDEVRELHPLLDDIFRRLNGITYVEYTHGPHEFGADFILERQDSLVKDNTYIAVIVKTTKILQNTSDVEEQIKECNIKRHIRNGKQEIRPHEIWVITSKNYSQNAKIKIADNFSNRKIHFFDSEWLLDLVDEHRPYYWHQLPIFTGAYLSQLATRLAALNSQTNILSLPSNTCSHIELDIIEADRTRYQLHKQRIKHRLVNLHEEIRTHRACLLEADMGYGKSTLARRIAQDLCSAESFKAKPMLPIYQHFKSFADNSALSLEDKISTIIGVDCFAEMRTAGVPVLLILDGVDEISNNSDICKDNLLSVLTEAKKIPWLHVLITSRPFKILDEIPKAVESIKRYEIRPLTIRKLLGFIRNVCQAMNLPDRLYEDLAKSDLFRQLPQNPIAASLLTSLLAENKQDLPSNLTELYAKSMELMLGRWDERQKLSNEKLFRTCERLAQHIAAFMIDNSLLYISEREARQMIQDFLRDRNIGVTEQEAFGYLLDRSNIFGHIADTDSIFFRHRSFAEYLYAQKMQRSNGLVVDEKAFHPYWLNIYFFYFGLLSECPDQLQRLIELEISDDRQRWFRLLQFGNYLLAAYQSPYKIVEQGLCKNILSTGQKPNS